MAIRFSCPACRQPIEVDDGFGGQSVGCPYCQKVVAAPSSSSWSAGDVPGASPAGSGSGPGVPGAPGMPGQAGFAPPPPPPGQMEMAGTTVTHRSPCAAWALVLMITYLVLTGIGWLVMAGDFFERMAEKTGPSPSLAEQQKAQIEIFEEIATTGRLPGNTVSATAGVLGGLCGLAGGIVAIVSLVKREPRKAMAIVSLVVCVSAICCPVYPAMSNTQWAFPPQISPTSIPAVEEADADRSAVRGVREIEHLAMA